MSQLTDTKKNIESFKREKLIFLNLNDSRNNSKVDFGKHEKSVGK